MAMKFFVSLAFYASFCFLYAHGFDCRDQPASTRKCFEEAGLQINDAQDMTLSNILFSQSASVCRDLNKYQNALTCSTGGSLQCMSADVASYSSTVAATNSALAKMCESITGMSVAEVDCVKRMYPSLLECGANKSRNYQSAGNEQSRCFAYTAGPECVIQVLSTCGCLATKEFVEIFKLLNPTSCPSVPVSTPVCQSGTDKRNSAANTQKLSLLPLFAIVFCAILGKM